MAKKVETAAERYRRIKDARIIEFESPSGMVWKLRRPNFKMFVDKGALPLSLASKIARTDGKAASFEELPAEEQAQLILFADEIVTYCTVDPKVVEKAVADDEISLSEVDIDDYTALVKWAMPGGGEAESLETFRQ